MNLAEQNPEKISIKCSRHQGEYIKSFPLHQSQKAIRETPEEIFFEFFLHPTYDFMQEILSYGKEVQVLEPEGLVEDIRNHLQESLNSYLNS